MKKILFAIALMCATNLLSAQITSSGGQVYLSEDALASYTNPTICVSPSMDYRTGVWRIKAFVGCVVGGPDSAEYPAGGVEFAIILTKAEVDAYTASVGTETEAILDVAEQAVIDALEAISLNSGITFSH